MNNPDAQAVVDALCRLKDDMAYLVDKPTLSRDMARVASTLARGDAVPFRYLFGIVMRIQDLGEPYLERGWSRLLFTSIDYAKIVTPQNYEAVRDEFWENERQRDRQQT